MKNEIVGQFESNLAREGKADATIKSYIGDVRLFLEWLKTKDAVFDGKLQRLFIKQYKNHLIKKNYAVDTFNKKINSLTCFNQFLIEAGYMENIIVYSNKDKIKTACLWQNKNTDKRNRIKEHNRNSKINRNRLEDCKKICR